MARRGFKFLNPPGGKTEDPVANCRSAALSLLVKPSIILHNQPRVGPADSSITSVCALMS